MVATIAYINFCCTAIVAAWVRVLTPGLAMMSLA
jgi:hypothetical protein